MKSKCLFLTGLFFLLCVSPSPASELYGRPITQIVLKYEDGSLLPKPEQLQPLIGIRPGDRLAVQPVRDSISDLYLKSLFRDIRVDAYPDKDGVRIEYTLTPMTIVEKIVIRGNHALSAGTIRESLPRVEGREYREEKLAAVRESVLTLYQAEGYYDASVAFRTEKANAPHRTTLLIEVHESLPTRIVEIAFSGNTVFKEHELLRVMKSKTGDRLKSGEIMDADMEAVLQKYTEAGYPAARPGPVTMSIRDRKAYLQVLGSEGPKVTVRFTGNEEFSSKKLSQALLIWSEHDVSDAMIESSADKIRNLYRELGYADVKVEVAKTEAAGALDLVFVVTEGRKTTVQSIQVQGNSYFKARELKRQLSLRESGWFRSGPYREDLLDKDVEYLHDLYVDSGFLAVTVKKKTDLIHSGRKAVVVIDINEGPQTMVGSIFFEGNKVWTDAELLEKVNLKPGAPFSERLLDEDKFSLQSVYSDKGYLFAKVDVDKTAPTDGKQDIKYRIAEDYPVMINRIILRGNEQTKDKVILRELLQKADEPYNYQAILTSQQRIYHLGFFGLARFEPAHPGEKEYAQDMLFTVEERPAGAVEFGVGYGDLDRLRGFVELSHRNLWGSALRGSIRFDESDILKQAALNLQEPWFLGRRIESRFSLAWSDSTRLNQDTREIYYQTRKASAAYGVEKVYDDVKASLTYQFENVTNFNVKPQAVLTQEDTGRVQVSSLSPGLIWDRRDDPFNPRKGFIQGIVLKEAIPQIWSEANFTKLTVQSSWFLPVESGIITALSVRAGMAWPHGTTDEVPLHERFYLGGSTTIRGYTQDSVGPSSFDGSTSIPTGGASMIVMNAELRMNPIEGFGIVLFTDAGNVYANQEINLHILRSSYGVGLRYGTPIGPLRVDYGRKIDRRPGETLGEFHFNIGHSF